MAHGDVRVSGRALEVTDPAVRARFVEEVTPPEPFLLFRADPTEVVRTGLDGDDLVVQVPGVPATRCAPCAEAPTRARSARCDPHRPPATSPAVLTPGTHPPGHPGGPARRNRFAAPRPPAPVRRPGEPAPRTALRRQSGGRRASGGPPRVRGPWGSGTRSLRERIRNPRWTTPAPRPGRPIRRRAEGGMICRPPTERATVAQLQFWYP